MNLYIYLTSKGHDKHVIGSTFKFPDALQQRQGHEDRHNDAFKLVACLDHAIGNL